MALTLVALSVCFWLLARALRRSAVAVPVTTEWLDDLSVDRYRAMLRLLEEEEIDFIREQPGYTREIERRFRKDRCAVAREYLRGMHTDFRRVCAVLKIVILQSQDDRPDLAAALLHGRLLFARSVVLYQFRLLLFRYGLPGFETPEMFRVFEAMRLELRTLIPAADAA